MMCSLKIQLWINMDFGIRETGGYSIVKYPVRLLLYVVSHRLTTILETVLNRRNSLFTNINTYPLSSA